MTQQAVSYKDLKVGDRIVGQRALTFFTVEAVMNTTSYGEPVVRILAKDSTGFDVRWDGYAERKVLVQR